MDRLGLLRRGWIVLVEGYVGGGVELIDNYGIIFLNVFKF